MLTLSTRPGSPLFIAWPADRILHVIYLFLMVPSQFHFLGFAVDCNKNSTLSVKKVEKTTFVCQKTW